MPQPPCNRGTCQQVSQSKAAGSPPEYAVPFRVLPRELLRAVALASALALTVAAPVQAESAPAPPAETATPAADPTPPAEAEAAVSATDAAPATEEPATLTPQQRRYTEAVESLESAGGAYDPGLAQHLMGLGMAYQQAGAHAEAVAILSRAAHVTRVNEGLYTVSDLPILEQLIESYAALGEWDAVGSSYHQMFQIHRRNYGEQDERLLPALQKLSAWHLRAYVDDLGEEPLNHLLTARNLYDSSLGILEARHGPADPRLAPTLRERALVDYYLASYVPSSPESLSFGTGGGELPQTPAYVLNGFSSGREALERVVELRRQDPASTPLERGEALAELGDWHQLFNRRQTAVEIYREALAAEAPVPEAATAGSFARPVALPVLPASFDGLQAAEADPGNAASITVAFAVDERGIAQDIQILDSQPPAADSQISKVRKRLRAMRFRPRFDAGQPVATSGLTYRYRYTP